MQQNLNADFTTDEPTDLERKLFSRIRDCRCTTRAIAGRYNSRFWVTFKTYLIPPER
jgi:hypothetical protein